LPLSEDEQRILSEIERSFYENDPAFARQVGSTTVYSHARRNLKWATVAFVVGLVVMVLSFASSLLLGVVGFGIMLGSAIWFERNLRRMGKAGWKSVSKSMPGGNLKNALGDARTRMRDRFRKREE
jgi:hypothetical protein